MRKLFIQLAVLLAFGGWSVPADAAWRMTTGEPIMLASGLRDGMLIVLENRCNVDATNRLWTSTNTYEAFDEIDRKFVFRVAMLPDPNPITGEPMIQLQSYDTQKWWCTDNHFTAASQEEATPLTVGRASKYTVLCKGEGWTEDNPVWTNDYREPNWDWRNGEALTFAGNINSTDDSEWYYITEIWGWYNYCNWANYRDVNPWYAYEVEEYSDPVGDLVHVMQQCEDGKYADFYLPGTDYGYCDPAIVAAYEAAYEAANDCLMNSASTDEQLVAAREKLEKAIEALQSGIILPKDGAYYYVVSSYSRFEAQQKVRKAWYKDDSRVRWKTLDENNISFLFKFIKQEDGSFAIQSAKDETYLTEPGSVSATIANTQSFFPTGGGAFYIKNGTDPSNGGGNVYHAESHGSGAGGSGNLCYWYAEGKESGSGWTIVEMSDLSRLDEMRRVEEQRLRTVAFNNELNRARSDSAAGYVMKNYIVSADQLSTNATEKSGEGPIANLIDGNNDTYFHTSWSAFYGEPHYFQVALKQPLQKFTVGFRRRHNTNNARPTQITILGSKDGTSFEELAVMPQAPDTLPTADSQLDYRTSKPIDLGAAYNYLRFRVDSTNTMGLEPASSADPDAPRYPYFHFAEFCISDEGFPLDADRSVALRPDMADAYAALKQAIDAALAKDPATVTQADIDALKAANAAFAKAYPDTTLLSSVIGRANDYAANVLVVADGQEAAMGMCTDQAAVDAMSAAARQARELLDANAKITRTEIDGQVATLEGAIKTFMDAVVMPKPNTWYFMKNLCTSREDGTMNSIVYPESNAVGAQIKWGNSIENGGTMNVKYLWRFVPVAGKEDVYAVQNMGTGYYLGEDRGRSTAFLLSDTAVEFKYAYVAGGELSLIQNKEGAYLTHAAASGKTLVPWTDGKGTASAWTFVEASADDQVMEVTLNENSGDIFCLPYDITGDFYGYNFDAGIEEAEVAAYTITDARYDENGDITEIGVTTKEIGEEGIPAGTPFLLIAGDINAEAGAGESLQVDLGLIFDSEISTVAKEDNGMIGLMSTTTVEQEGVGYFSLTDGLQRSGKNISIVGQSGYIDGHKVKAGGEAEFYIPMKNGVITEIKQAIKDSKAIVNVYTVDGKLVRKNVKNADALKGLQKGLYVVNGKVYSVK